MEVLINCADVLANYILHLQILVFSAFQAAVVSSEVSLPLAAIPLALFCRMIVKLIGKAYRLAALGAYVETGSLLANVLALRSLVIIDISF